MKRISRLPVLAGAIVAAIVVTSLAPTPASRVAAQVTGYRYQSNTYYGPYGQGLYSPYGQGRYGNYGQGYYGHSGQSRGYHDWAGRNTYGYSAYGLSPYRYGTSSRYGYGDNYNYRSGSRFGYLSNPYVRSYGGARYYQPYTGGVYFGFGNY